MAPSCPGDTQKSWVRINKKMLSKVYNDPKRGFQSASKLVSKVKGVSLSKAQSFLKNQKSYQLTTTPYRPRSFPSVTAPYPRYTYQIDIMVYDRYSFHNYKYILTCIDVYLRFVSARPLTTREAPTIKKALTSIFEEMGLPLNINCDQEFVQSLLLKNGYYQTTSPCMHRTPTNLIKMLWWSDFIELCP